MLLTALGVGLSFDDTGDLFCEMHGSGLFTEKVPGPLPGAAFCLLTPKFRAEPPRAWL